MSLQTIINHAETLEIDRRRVVGVQYTRSETAKTSETPTRNPWKFTITLPAALQYGENRALLEAIDQLDKSVPEIISFNAGTTSMVQGNTQWVGKTASAGLGYLFAYQGGVLNIDGTPNYAILNATTVTNFVGNQLTLTLPPKTITGGEVIFRAGDFIQIQGFPFPFTVRYDVVSQANTQQQITVTTHRPNWIGTATISTITGQPLIGSTINVGNQCQFQMFCPNMPTYKLSPGGKNAIISWSSDFKLYEYTGYVSNPAYYAFF